MSDRTRGIIVQPVTVPDGALWAYGPFAAHVVAQDYTGQAYLICHEGVGHPIDSEQYALCQPKGDPVDLADFIRTFGARLDNNHYLWVRKLGGTFVITGTYPGGRRAPALRTQTPNLYLDGYTPGEGSTRTLWYETPDGARTLIQRYR